MATTIFKPNTKAKSAEVNANFYEVAGDRLVGLDLTANDGSLKSEFNIGDLTAITNGSLVNDILLREGGVIKIYNASGTLLKTVSLDEATTTQRGQVYLNKQITVSNNATDSDHDMDFTDGVFQFDDGSGQAVATAMTKRLDANWVAGNNQGGLDTGSVAVDTTYHLFAIYNPSTSTADFLFSASLSPTLPSGYTKKKRIASLLTDGAGNIRNGTFTFNKDGSYRFELSSQVTELSGNFVDDPTFLISSPPLCYAILSLQMDASSGGKVNFISNVVGNNNFFSLRNNWNSGGWSGGYNNAQIGILVDSNSNIKVDNVPITGQGTPSGEIVTQGWIDNNL